MLPNPTGRESWDEHAPSDFTVLIWPRIRGAERKGDGRFRDGCRPRIGGKVDEAWSRARTVTRPTIPAPAIQFDRDVGRPQCRWQCCSDPFGEAIPAKQTTGTCGEASSSISICKHLLGHLNGFGSYEPTTLRCLLQGKHTFIPLFYWLHVCHRVLNESSLIILYYGQLGGHFTDADLFAFEHHQPLSLVPSSPNSFRSK